MRRALLITGATVVLLTACQSRNLPQDIPTPVTLSGSVETGNILVSPNDATPTTTDSLEVSTEVPAEIDITVHSGAIVMGNPDAPRTLIMYDDYGCIYCREFGTTDLPWLLQTFVQRDTINIERIFVPQSEAGMVMATVALCSEEQDRFTETDLALHASPVTADAQIPALAAAVKLNLKSLRTCMASETTISLLQTAADRAAAASVTRLPAFQLGGNRWIGIETRETLQRLIDDAR